MELKYHGVGYEENGSVAWLYLGVLRLLQVLETTFRFPLQPGQKRPEWPLKWFDRKFDQAVSKFQDSFSKFERAAWHFGRCVEDFKHYHNATQINDFAKAQAALGDIPLYLDSILFYLRIQADCLANVIPNLYGEKGRRANISRDSFHRFAQWFARTQPSFDPEYATILAENLSWFEMLAGPISGESRGQGLRDIMTHYRGLYQLGWNLPREPNDLQLRAMVIGDSGFVCEDLVPALRLMVIGFFEYLEKTYIYFTDRLRAEIDDELLPTRKQLARYIRFQLESNTPWLSFWVYPMVSSEKL